jgi:hypothetical protein
MPKQPTDLLKRYDGAFDLAGHKEKKTLWQWYEREKHVYLAWTGRDGTDDGFREHVHKLHDANPDAFTEMLENARMNEEEAIEVRAIPARKN